MKDAIKTFSTPHGEFAVDTVADAKMAAVLARGDYHQSDTIELLSALATPYTIFVDGGAHIGTITIPLARLAMKTIAFEADPNTAALLRQNIERNGVRAEVREKGIGRETGTGAVVAVHEGNAGAHTLTVGEGGIPIVTLDSELDRFDLLKLDVEGMELAVFEGARRIFSEAKPTVFFEVNISQLRLHHASLRALDSFFRTRKYQLYLPFRQQGTLVLGVVPSISIVAACMYPGAYLLHRTSSVFDVLAVPQERVLPVPVVSAWRTAVHVIGENLRDKKRRVQKYFV